MALPVRGSSSPVGFEPRDKGQLDWRSLWLGVQSGERAGSPSAGPGRAAWRLPSPQKLPPSPQASSLTDAQSLALLPLPLVAFSFVLPLFPCVAPRLAVIVATTYCALAVHLSSRSTSAQGYSCLVRLEAHAFVSQGREGAPPEPLRSSGDEARLGLGR